MLPVGASLPQLESLTDEQLVLHYRSTTAQSERELSLNELFKRQHQRVTRWCWRMIGERETAADLAQEVLAKAYRYLDSFGGNARFSTWLYSIARNHCRSEYKARATRPATVSIDTIRLEDRSEGLQAAVERVDLERRFRLLMQVALNEMESHILSLHYVDGVPLDAITQRLRLQNASGAKAYVVSARRKLGSAAARMKTLPRTHAQCS